MAFDWNQYPQTGGVTGNPNVDPSQLQVQQNQGFLAGDQGNASIWGTTPGGSYNPYGPGPMPSLPDPNAPGSVTFDPSQASPSSPMAGGGGINPGGGGTQPQVGSFGPSVGGAQSGSQDPRAYFDSIFPGTSLSPQDLLAHEADLKAHGITLIKNAAGQPGKIQLADGSAYDVIQGAGAGQNLKQWNQIAGPGGVPTGGGAGNGDPRMGTLNQFGQQYGFMYAPFTPPSAADAMNSPGTQYAINEAQRTMQNSAAAKGSLLNGRVLQGENNAIMNQAAGQYQDVYNRAYQTQTRNQDAPFNKYTTLADIGQRAAGAS